MADNAGYDSSDLVAKLRAAHYEGRSDAGLGASPLPRFAHSLQRASPLGARRLALDVRSFHVSFCAFADMEKGVVGSMRECGVTESYKLKRQVILSASEAAEMILRVDDSEFATRFPIRSSSN